MANIHHSLRGVLNAPNTAQAMAPCAKQSCRYRAVEMRIFTLERTLTLNPGNFVYNTRQIISVPPVGKAAARSMRSIGRQRLYSNLLW
jgi:hypothetical protein